MAKTFDSFIKTKVDQIFKKYEDMQKNTTKNQLYLAEKQINYCYSLVMFSLYEKYLHELRINRNDLSYSDFIEKIAKTKRTL